MMVESSSTTPEYDGLNQPCLLHHPTVDASDIPKKFTSRTWATFLQYVDTWKDYPNTENGNTAINFLSSGNFWNLSSADSLLSLPVPINGGFHRKCYQRFTDATRVARVSKRKFQETTEPPRTSGSCDETPHQGKKQRVGLRSESTVASKPSRSKHVLPAECIICKKVRYIRNKNRSRVLEKLSTCELLDSGSLLQAAHIRKDENLIRQLSNQDCVAIEVSYHRSCHREYTRPLTKNTFSNSAEDNLNQYSKSFNKFCGDVIEKKLIQGKEIMRLIKLRNIFIKIVRDEENMDASGYKSWNLKRRLQNQYPQLRFIKSKRATESDFVYTDDFDADMVINNEKVEMMSDTDATRTTDSDSEAAAKPVNPTSKFQGPVNQSSLKDRYTCAFSIREEINNIPARTLPWPPTSADLTMDAATDIVPVKLYNLIAWMTNASTDPEDDRLVKVSEHDNRCILAIAQDIIYLSHKGRKLTPKHLSLSMAIRHLSGSCQLIGLLNGFGHSTSHSAVLEHDTALATKEFQRGNTLPSCLRKGVQTTLVWDNNDFGEETLSGKGTTHNTNGIAIQHIPPQKLSRLTSPEDVKKTRKRSLPAPECEILPFLGGKKSQPNKFPKNIDVNRIQSSHTELGYYMTKMPTNHPEHVLLPSWTGFNQLLSKEAPTKDTIAYLPVIDSSPTDMSTVNTILQKSVDIADSLELKSVAVVFDQAIYCKAQAIKWQVPEFQERIVTRLGAFHTAMTFMACLGKRFQDAGLQDVLIESGVLAPGSANGAMSGKQYNRSLRCHKIMSEALQRLRWSGFLDSLPEETAAEYSKVTHSLRMSFPGDEYTQVTNGTNYLSMRDAYNKFIQERCKMDKTYSFWCTYLSMVEQLLLFIRASREGDWNLHLSSIRAIAPWMFAYDRHNYARYLPIYWLEMMNLPKTHPEIHESFLEGHFAVQRQDVHGFARIPCDMTIEQTANRDSKTRGGVTGFSVKKGAVNRWTAAFHERAAITRQCEEMAGKGPRTSTRKELTDSRKCRDEKDVSSTVEVITNMINPFNIEAEFDAEEIVNISSGAFASASITNDLMKAEEIGEKAFTDFCNDRLQGEGDINDTLRKFKLLTFADLTKEVKAKFKGKEITMKSDRDLFARLIVIGRARNVDLRNMMSYSLSPFPLAIASTNGCLVKTNKASLLHALEKNAENEDKPNIVEPPKESVWVLDGMALLQQLNPKNMPVTFGLLARKILKILTNLAKANHSPCIHFVTDNYPTQSIKNAERSKRAVGGSNKIKITNPEQNVPKQWKKFMANSYNKQQLTRFLFNQWSQSSAEDLMGVTIVVAHDNECHSIKAVNAQEGTPGPRHSNAVEVEAVGQLFCDHEEADTRMLLHAKYISDTSSGKTPVVISSPDTDVFVIAIALTPEILSKIYFHTGKDDNKRTIDLQVVHSALGCDVANALIGLHCMTGCDSVSAFFMKGKVKALRHIQTDQESVDALTKVGNSFTIEEDLFIAVEKLVCKLYGSKNKTSVNDVRFDMFKEANRIESTMPPNRDALRKHILRGNFQSRIYKLSLMQFQELPSPNGHGWLIEDGQLAIDWMLLSPAAESIAELTKCSCKKNKCQLPYAKDNCCASLGLPCTDLCKCQGCENNFQLEEDEEDVDTDEDE